MSEAKTATPKRLSNERDAKTGLYTPKRSSLRRSRSTRSAPGVRKFDTVQVVRLATLEREFDGTEPVVRAPRVGDIAMVAHDWEPDDPAGTVIAEMTDEDGYTVWSADFDKDELVCISRPDC